MEEQPSLSPAPSRPRVLVIRGGAIGDFILTLPAIRLIRESIPNCHLEVLGYPGIMELAVAAGLADATRSLEHRTMAMLFARQGAVDPALQDYLRSFTLIISYLYDPDGHFRGSLERIGVKTLLDCPHRVVPGEGHASVQLAKPLERLAMFLEDEPDWRRPFFLGEEKTFPPSRLVIHLGSGSVKKNWPLENWQELTSQIHQHLPHLQFIIVTGEAEEARGLVAGDPLLPVPYEHWHGLPLVELSRRLAGCDLYLGHDTGISHLASACGLPSLLLFGPTDPEIWAPPQRSVQVVDAESENLADLPVSQVWEAFLAFFPSK